MDYRCARASSRDHRCISIWGTLILKDIGIKAIAIWLVILAIPWGIDLEHIGGQRVTNNHIIHCMCHVFLVGVIAIFLVMEVVQIEKRDPCELIVSYAMNKQER